MYPICCERRSRWPSGQGARMDCSELTHTGDLKTDTPVATLPDAWRYSRSQYTDTGPTSPSADPITPGAWQGWRLLGLQASALTMLGASTQRQKVANQPGYPMQSQDTETRPTSLSTDPTTPGDWCGSHYDAIVSRLLV